eukprot:tig00020816_g14129.t1
MQVSCAAGQYSPSGSGQCLACPVNHVAAAGAAACSACSLGTVSEDGLECRPCESGTFRNATIAMTECTPCPFGTYLPEAGGSACLPCPAGKLCPVATSQPIDVGLRVDRAFFTSPAPSGPTGRLRRALVGAATAARRLLQSGSAAEGDVEKKSEEFIYPQNKGSISQAVVRTEQATLDRAFRVFTWIGIGAAITVALVGACFVVYVRVIPSTPAGKRARLRRLRWFHRMYTDSLAHDEKSDPPGEEFSKDRPEDESEQKRSVRGSFFTVVGIAGVVIAILFVAVQYSMANYTNPGTSPSASSISGPFVVSATFRGYDGPCGAGDVAHERAGFVGPDALAFEQADAGRSCKVTWTCPHVAANDGTFVTLQLKSSRAFAVSIPYSVQARSIPEYVEVQGMVTTSSEDAVFRGRDAVDLPLDLTPMHFSDAADGRPRYFAAVSSSETERAERDPTTFVVCPPGRAVDDCAEARVTLRAKFKPSQVYLLVDRITRTTALDAGAVEILGLLLTAYVTVKSMALHRPAAGFGGVMAAEEAYGARGDREEMKPTGRGAPASHVHMLLEGGPRLDPESVYIGPPANAGARAPHPPSIIPRLPEPGGGPSRTPPVSPRLVSVNLDLGDGDGAAPTAAGLEHAGEIRSVAM